MIFAIYGLILSVLKKYSFGLTILIYFIFNLYIVASWSNWWYAESFSQRALIPSYALLSLPLALCLNGLFNLKYHFLKYFLTFTIILFLLLNVFQTWQFLNEIIHPSRMTREAYFAAFLKSKRSENFNELLLVVRASENSHFIDDIKYYKTKEWIINFEDISGNSSLFAHSGSTSFKADVENIYSPGIEKEFQEITDKDHVKLKVSLQMYATMDAKENPGTLVITFEHNGYTYGYMGVDIENKEIDLNDWVEIETTYITPDIRRKSNKLKVYYWHRGKMPVFIDDLKVEVWEEK